MTDNLPTPYGQWNPQAQAETDDEYAFVSDFMKLEKGYNLIRVFPPHPNMGNRVWLPVNQHFVPDKGDGKGGVIICPAKQFKRERRHCPICAMINQLEVNGGADSKELRRRRASLGWITNAVRMNRDQATGHLVAETPTPQKLTLSDALKRKIWDTKNNTGLAIGDKLDPGNSLIPFPDPISGRNILVDKKEAQPWWEVSFYPNEEFPLSAIEGLQEEWWMGLHDLTADIVVKPEEELNHIASLLASHLLTPRGAATQAPQTGNYTRGPAQRPAFPPQQKQQQPAAPGFSAPKSGAFGKI